MPETRLWSFAPFHLDLEDERLWQGTEPVRLTAKAFAVLCYLVEHAGQLVTKDDLFTAVWASSYVSDAALAVCIGEIRRALGDTAQMPQYLETVRGRGYRFVAPVTASSLPTERSVAEPSQPMVVPRPGLHVGREAELATLQQRWAQARQGARQVVFVTGEAGIGKTTLVDAFVAQVAATERVWHSRGQCIEQHGIGEAYLPLLEILGRLGRAADGGYLTALLHQQAPSWLVHLPALVPPDTFEALQRRAGGTTRERMLRELAEAIEVLTLEQPLVLVLEDLHWSDGATLDWLAYVARRREAARLLVLGTYRPVEAIVRLHPVHNVTQELRLHGQATEVILSYLPATGVATYLAERFGDNTLPVELSGVLHQRTDGNPLFLVTVVDDLVQQGVIRHEPAGWTLVGGLDVAVQGVPESLRQLLEQQFAQLSPAEQILLEAASVAGTEFVAAAVAAGVAETVETVEMQCEALARRGQFVQGRGSMDWPDGTVTARYGFFHALYREFLYNRVHTSQRVRWHRQIGLRLEMGYGPLGREIAAELAEHFVRGRDAGRAVQYLQYAAEQALRRNAHQEAIAHATKKLEILRTLPDLADHASYELDAHTVLGAALTATRGYASPEVAETYSRARDLSQHLCDRLQLFMALRGLWNCHLMRTDVQIARTLGEQLFDLAVQEHTPALLVEAHRVLGTTLFFQGELVAASRHLEDGIRLYDRQQHQTHTVHFGADPGVTCRVYAARTLWLRGYPEQALHRGHEALRLAHDLEHPFSLGFAVAFLTDLFLMRREGQAAQEQNEALQALVRDYGFPHWVAIGMINAGWSLIEQGAWEVGITQLSHGLEVWQSTGAGLEKPTTLAVLAETYGKIGRSQEGLTHIAEALTLVEQTGEQWWKADICRIQGELMLQQAPAQVLQVEDCFHRALAVAHQQQAKSLELRAAMSLCRLWQQQGKHQEARELLAPIYGWFSEGFDTVDLQAARGLLEALATEAHTSSSGSEQYGTLLKPSGSAPAPSDATTPVP